MPNGFQCRGLDLPRDLEPRLQARSGSASPTRRIRQADLFNWLRMTMGTHSFGSNAGSGRWLLSVKATSFPKTKSGTLL